MDPVSVTVVGSVHLDLVAALPRLPDHGETLIATGLTRVPGGKGANQALAARRLGLPVRLLAAVGADPEADAALEVPEQAVITAAQHATGLFVLNASPARPVPADVLARADLVVVNRAEHAALPGLHAARALAVTDGERGAVLLREGQQVAAAFPPQVTAVDGTAAGDAFIAAALASLLRGLPDAELLTRACAAGALAATRHGAQPSLPTAAEIDEVLAR